jgi:hypothetical protein
VKYFLFTALCNTEYGSIVIRAALIRGAVEHALHIQQRGDRISAVRAPLNEYNTL